MEAATSVSSFQSTKHLRPAAPAHSSASSSSTRRASFDLGRTRNFASSLSLRKDLDAYVANPPAPGPFTRLRNFSQSRLRKDDTPHQPAAAHQAHLSGLASLPHHANDQACATLPHDSPSASDASSSKLMKRRSRLLDAFRSKRPQSTFEVVRKPLAQRDAPSHAAAATPPEAAAATASASASASPSGAAAKLAAAPAGDALHEPPSSSSSSVLHDGVERDMATRWPEALQTRGAHPPSTTKTRRPAPSLGMPFGRRHSGLAVDTAVSASSKAGSPLPSPGTDAPGGSFNLHSFRNVRSGSDASRAEAGSTIQSRRQTVFAYEEFVTPTEELVLPSPFAEDAKPTGSVRNSVVLSPPHAKGTSPGRPAAALFQSHTNASSISVAKFRQAARSRTETGSANIADEFGAVAARINAGDETIGGDRPPNPTLSGTAPAAISPSQELAALEAELSQGGRSTPLLRRLKDKERSVSPAAITAPGEAEPTADEPAATLRTAVPATKGTSVGSTVPPSASVRARERGLFIVVEGLDRAGKSTQVARLANKLGAKEIKFPNRTTAIGQMINSYLAQTSNLDDKAIHLLFSANRWECVQSILDTLAEGGSIVCDRYAFSGIAYSCAKGLHYDWCRAPDIGLPLPDLTLFLDLDAEAAAVRGGYGQERYEKREFQTKVRNAFRLVANDVESHGGKWMTVDAARSLDEVTREIQRVVLQSTATIDLRTSQVGKLFEGSAQRAQPPQPPSSWIRDEQSLDRAKRQSIDGLASLGGGSFLRHFRSDPQSAGAPALQSSDPKPATSSYVDQLAAMRSAAAGTLTGFFGTQTDAEKPATALGLETNAVSPTARGQGVDSERVLAGYHGARPGRKMTLVEMIDQMEAERSPGTATGALPPPTLPWVAAEGHSRARSQSQNSAAGVERAASPATNADRFPSTFALGNRSRRSLHGLDGELHAQPQAQTQPQPRPRPQAAAAGGNSSDTDESDSDDAPLGMRPSVLAAQVAQVAQAAQAAGGSATTRTVPLITPSPQRATSISQKTSTTLESAATTPATEEGESTAAEVRKTPIASPPPLTRSPAELQRSLQGPDMALRPQSRLSLDPPKSSTSPASRPHSTSPAPAPSRSPGSPHLYQSMPMPMPGDGNHQLSTQQLAMLTAQQQQLEFQQHYMQYMAAASMMQDPAMAQRAQYHYQYQMMLMQQQHHHYFAHDGSVYGGSEIGTGSRVPPTAALMQPGVGLANAHISSSMSDYGVAPSGPKVRRSDQPRHSRTRSSSGGLNGPNNGGGEGGTSKGGAASPPLPSSTTPMLSMMMSPPPPPQQPQLPSSSHPAAQPPPSAYRPFLTQTPPFFPYGFARPGPSAAQSEIGTSTVPRSHRGARGAGSRLSSGGNKLV
ncbi:Thymidylate kinase [Thecaphora frezii]